jgi:DNA-binding cell septation regulator SpoVG
MFNADVKIRVTRTVLWHRKSGNALAFFDVEAALPTGEVRTYADLKLCQSGQRLFLSEPQDRQADGTFAWRYKILDRALRRRLEEAAIAEYERQRPGQLAFDFKHRGAAWQA